MSSGLGYPDWQKIQQWLGAPLDQATGAAIGAGAINLGPYNLASWASIIVALKPTGGKVAVTVKQKISGGPAGLELDETFIVNAGTTTFEAVVLFGDVVSLTFQGDTIGETVDYAIYPSNTTTNAQVITNATINVQHNAALVAAEGTLDFEDAGANVFGVVDDAANTRVKITPPRRITGRVSAAGAIIAGTGFTITKLGAGNYQINFVPVFAAVPIVIAIPSNVGALTYSTEYGNLAAASVQVFTFTSAGALTDNEFAFVAETVG